MKKFLILLILILSATVATAVGTDFFCCSARVGRIYDSIDDQVPTQELSGYILDLSEFDQDLCYLSIGAMRNFEITQKLARDIGVILKRKGFDFVIFGNLRLLTKDSENKTDFFNSSYSLIAEHTYRMIRGFEAAGIFPVISVSRGDDKNAYKSLIQKSGSMITFSYDDDSADIFFKENVFLSDKQNILSLAWEYPTETLSQNIMEVFKASIVLSGYRKDLPILIYRQPSYNDDKSVIYFSQKVKDLAEQAVQGKTSPSGNKFWNW
ncbi:MAG TPA: hypothetical protein PLI28_10580 [Petrotogaceae bacterium]|nr:hypothetical protein [Petrotogaceae bacterium]